MVEVSLVRQLDSDHCVPACLQAILTDLGREKDQQKIAEELQDYFRSPEIEMWTVGSEAWIQQFAGVLQTLGLIEGGDRLKMVHNLPANRKELENLRMSGFHILIFYNHSPQNAVRFAGLYDDRSFLADPGIGMRPENELEFVNLEAMALCFRPTRNDAQDDR
jgi:hypothetical protein